MKSSSKKQSHMLNSGRSDALIVSACASAVLLMALSGGAYAQQAAPTTIVVTGIRTGIEAAISVKRNSDNIVESISAEDIGKLPDTSIAESIARLPGVGAQRLAGRAQVISVRGLSPDFSTTLLNGREMVSTGDNRSVEFDQYPAELLSGVTVYKTPDSGLVGQGLSGTLDMQTVRPLNFASRVTALNARGSDNSLGAAANAKASGNRLSVSYIDQYLNRTLGFAIGFAHQETPVAENQTGTYEPWNTGGLNGVPSGTTYVTNGIKALRRTGVTKRDGLMATLEYKPSKNWTSTLDLFTAKAQQTDTANQFEVNFGWNGGNGPAVLMTNPIVNSNNTLVGGVLQNVWPLVRGEYNKRDDKIDAFGWNNVFSWGGVKMNADISHSKATRDEFYVENNTQLTTNPYESLTLAIPTGAFQTMNPTNNYSDPTKLILRNSIYGSGWGRTPNVADELTSYKLGAKIPAPASLSRLVADFDVGVNYADRSKKKHQPEGPVNMGPQGDTPIASQYQYSPVSLGFAGSNLGSIPAWNVPATVSAYQTFAPNETDAGWKISKAWNVYEKITTTYAKANIDAQWGAVNVRGNAGVQIVSADQSSTSNYWDGSAPAGHEVKPFKDGKTYNDVLPSLNLAFGLDHEQTVRVALAKEVARPRMDELRSALDFGIDTATGKPGASGGNPRLDPWRATALDISYEKYFGTKAYVAVAGFYKDLKTYIYSQAQTYDFSPFVAGYVPPVGSPAAQTMGNYTAPYNGKGGKLSGIELSASLPLNLLTKSLDGFGVVASTSLTNSAVKILADSGSQTAVGNAPITLPGLSKTVSNLTFYYEKSGFEARVSQRRRSDFIGEIGNFNGNRTLRYVVGENITDAQVGYAFNEGSMKGLGLLLQMNNLTNAAYQTYGGTKDRPLEYIKWGRSVLLGANYKF